MGGREGRRAERSAVVSGQQRPVQPGQSGGRYQPLNPSEMEGIHRAVLDALQQIGIGGATPSCRERVCEAGGSVDAEGRLLFPRALVEDVIASAARNLVLAAQDQVHDMELSGFRTYFGTAGAAVHVVDPIRGEYRDSRLQDLYEAARVVDAMEHIHFFQRCMVPRDVPDPREMDFNTCYASISGTRKHVGTSFVAPAHAEEVIDMLEIVAGSEKKWRDRPFVSCSCCHVVPPLRFGEEALRVLEVCVRRGMPILLLSALQAGATGPAALAGSLVQSIAEVLAGLVYVNLLQPGHPAICGTWPFVSDLRSGAMSGGGGEQAILMAACGQMGRFYDLPTGIAAGMADAKLPDAQSGYEKAYTDALAGHSGANLVYEAAGMHASLLGCCLESLVIDNDMLGAINRTIRGIEITEDALSLEAMKEVCLNGPDHYLGHPQTLTRMQSDYVYPEIGDRHSPKEWDEAGRPALVVRARARVDEILAAPRPEHIGEALHEEIGQKFPMRLFV
jgi:trimethylamine--corrinoid protein Co-methyltransferase